MSCQLAFTGKVCDARELRSSAEKGGRVWRRLIRIAVGELAIEIGVPEALWLGTSGTCRYQVGTIVQGSARVVPGLGKDPWFELTDSRLMTEIEYLQSQLEAAKLAAGVKGTAA